jgi:hypothetical protein
MYECVKVPRIITHFVVCVLRLFLVSVGFPDGRIMEQYRVIEAKNINGVSFQKPSVLLHFV